MSRSCCGVPPVAEDLGYLSAGGEVCLYRAARLRTESVVDRGERRRIGTLEGYSCDRSLAAEAEEKRCYWCLGLRLKSDPKLN